MSVPPKASGRIVFVMVGLPARGKTFIARKVARYLSWLGHKTRVFNVGAYRRERLGSHQHHSFFDPDNDAGNAARLEMANVALDDLLEWIKSGDIGIYDATDSTRNRRRHIRARCEAAGHQVVFLESICNDPAIVEANVRDTKLRSPDYAGIAESEAVADFRMRIAHYERAYETVDEDEGSFIKIIDVGRTVVVHRIDGYVPARLVFFLINLHIQQRSIWLTRHGESEFNVLGRIGGDTALSRDGLAYAESLGEFFRDRAKTPPVIWTSTMRRTTETAEHITGTTNRAWRALDEIDAGVCDGLTYAEIAEAMPAEFAARAADKFRYRYPRGESYQDVIQRLEPVIFELERERAPVLIIGHQAVLRALYAYMMDQPPEACPRISMPLHTLIRLKPTPYGCDETRFPLAPPPLDEEGFRER
jgi:broad specificity phosphatase PhoE/predicted kinase